MRKGPTLDNEITVTRPLLPEFNEYVDEIRSIWESNILTNSGEKYKTLQNELRNYLGIDYLNLVVNGHMALELAIQAMGLSGEVITTPYTFVSTTQAILRNGLTPVFCDINADDYTIDVSKIEKLITKNTSAIVPVHVYGNVCDVDAIDYIAKRYNLKVIYDAAHAFGVKYRGVGICNFGDASCLSFHATKVFNTIEGGAICSNDNLLSQKIDILRNFGICGYDEICDIGTNAKMNEFSAAMGICNLKYINAEINKRKMIFEKYCEYLSGIPGLKLLHIKKEVTPNYAYFPVVFDEKKFGASRDDVYKKLCSKGISARKYFFPSINKIESFRTRIKSGDTPIAWSISNSVLALPLYSGLSYENVYNICNIILNSRK